jgi:hypothetical protein
MDATPTYEWEDGSQIFREPGTPGRPPYRIHLPGYTSPEQGYYYANTTEEAIETMNEIYRKYGRK